jgi:triacylglycerol lipase
MSTEAIQLQYPVVLIHGLGARRTYGPIHYFYGFPKLLKDGKNSVLIPKLTALQTIETRAQQLKNQIQKAFPEGKVNLIGHSMGGLDARYLIAQLGFADRVASLTTIGTPHRGSTLCDLASELLPSGAFRTADRLLSYMDSSTGAFRQISRRYCQDVFSTLAPADPRVAYFSATSAISKPFLKSALPLFWVPHRILQKYEGDNDGFVSVESAQFGTPICTYQGDHYAQIGQFMGKCRGLNHMKFYREILLRLRREGF